MIRIQSLEAHDFKLLRDVELAFPERGRILIRGPNESGKSTLFEAIFFGLFGQPLVTETSRGRLEDVIRYGTEEAEVVVAVSMDDMALCIRRCVRRGRPNSATLEILDAAGGHRETIVGVQAVNARVTSELGLDSEALLASCFVEQKKLDRLEGMSRAQREASLMKLLNLDRLLTMEDAFRVRPTDTQRRLELERRHALAALATELPECELQRDALQGRVRRYDALAALDTALAAQQLLALARHEFQGAQAAEARAAEAAATSAAIGASIAGLEAAWAARGRARDAELAAGAARQRALDLGGRAVGDPVTAAARLAALRRLARRVACLEGVRAAHEKLVEAIAVADLGLQTLSNARHDLNDLRRELVQAGVRSQETNESVRTLVEDLRAFDVSFALGAWNRLDVQDADDAGAGGAAAAAGLEQRRALRGLVAWSAGLATWFGVAAVAVMVVHPRTDSPLASTAAVVVMTGALAMILRLLRSRWHRWRHEVANVARLSGKVAAGIEAARERAAQRSDLRARLAALNAALPSSSERLAEVRAELAQRLDGRTRQDIEQARDQAFRASVEADAAADRLRERDQALTREYGYVDAAAMGDSRDAAAQEVARVEGFIGRLAVRVGTEAAGLAVADDLHAIARARGAAEEALAGAAEAERTMSAALAEAEAADTRAAEAWAEAERSWAAAERPWTESERSWRQDDEPVPSWDQLAPDDVWMAAQTTLAHAYAAAGGAGVDAAHRTALQATARIGAETDAADRAWTAALAHALEALDSAPLPGDRSPALTVASSETDLLGVRAAIASTLPTLPPEHPDEVIAARDRVDERVRILRHDVSRLETELGLRAADLDVTAAGREADAFTRELEVRGRAADMVEEAARSVAAAVLPSTMDYLRRLLPRLTGHRYFDARLTDDYHIEVWDDLAGDWRRKAIFSGGAKDQFSLALRLAFALATLPEERGTAPGFLFLDEPLGSFDAERAAALIAVLTEGEVARSFDQVFLVSHVPVGDGLFDYRITMADGQVTEADLPHGVEWAEA